MRKFSTVPFQGTPQQETQLREWLRQQKNMRGIELPALQKAQEIYGYLPIEVQRIIADELNVPLEDLYGIATF